MEDRPPRSVVLVKDGKWLVPPEARPANWESILPEGSASGRREVSRGEVPPRIESLPRPALAEPTPEAVAESVASVAQATEAQVPSQPKPKRRPHNAPYRWGCSCGWVGVSDDMVAVDNRNSCPSCGKMGEFHREPDEKPHRQHQVKGEPWNHPSWKELRRAIKRSAKGFGAEPELLDAALVLCAGMFTRTGPVLRRMTGVRNEKNIVKRCYELGLWKHGESAVTLGEMKPEHGDMELWMISMAITGELHRHENGSFSLAEKASS